jgi:hypothetical protein
MELCARRQAFYAPTCLVIAGCSLLFARVTAFGADLDGIWRSQGYGYVFNFQGSGLKAFEVTRTTCVPGFTATRLPTAGSDRGVTFTTTDRDVFFVRPGGDTAHQTLHFEGSASDMRIDRLPRLARANHRPTFGRWGEYVITVLGLRVPQPNMRLVARRAGDRSHG